MSKQISEAKLLANRENAQHSTGPVTEEGKRISSHNALKTGLTGRTVLLPTDDVAAYQAHMDRLEARYQPKTDEERQHVEILVHIEWRLLRIPTLETGLLAVGRERCAHLYPNAPAESRAAMIEAEVLMEFAKPLANLALQETRLNRQHANELAKLTVLLEARRKRESKQLDEAASFYLHCKGTDTPFVFNDLASVGFEFSFEDLQRRIAVHTARKQPSSYPSIKAHYAFQEIKNAA